MIKSGEMVFRPRARLLKLLGGELIRDEVMAVVELVKNAHDADASIVRLEMLDASTGNGEIRIIDDGCGMTFDQLRDHWMQPAGSSKRNGSRYTPSGRRMLGEKGVGRFASDRLGRHLELRTRSAVSGEEVIAEFDWDAFDDERKLLSEVQTSWRIQKMSGDSIPGTEIIIRDLRDSWSQKKFRKVSTRLQRLLNPLHQLGGFRIEISSNEFPDYSGTLRQQIIDDAPYRMTVRYDGNGTLFATYRDEGEVKIPWNGNPLACGPARVVIHAFDLETNALARIGSPMEVRAWLRQWSGVSVYRDGFRVLPYGEPDDDWLRLDRRRVNNPMVHLSNNQIIAFVEISSEENPGLRDQTNRGGMIHGREYEDLKRLAVHTLQMVESERQIVRRGRPIGSAQSDDIDNPADPVDAICSELESLGKEIPGRRGSRLRGMVGQLRDVIDARVGAQGRELKEYRRLAALGLSMNSIGLVSRARIHELNRHIDGLEIDRSGEWKDPGALSHLTWLLGQFREHASYVERLTTGGSRVSRTLDLKRELEAFEQNVQTILRETGSRLVIDYPREEVVRLGIAPSTLHHVLLILLRNTLDWAGSGNSARMKIRYRQSSDGAPVLLVSDNGPGIPPGLRQKVFEPGFSTRENASGMGLTIARELLREAGADLVLNPPKGRAGVIAEIRLARSRLSRG